jgi:hypothetical protein
MLLEPRGRHRRVVGVNDRTPDRSLNENRDRHSLRSRKIPQESGISAIGSDVYVGQRCLPQAELLNRCQHNTVFTMKAEFGTLSGRGKRTQGSDRRIAKHVGVHGELVSKVRETIELLDSSSSDVRRLGPQEAKGETEARNRTPGSGREGYFSLTVGLNPSTANSSCMIALTAAA